MPKSDSKINEYATKHKEAAEQLLKKAIQVNSKHKSKLYTILSRRYLQAFTSMHCPALKHFSMIYHSKNARGIGDHRGRLKKIIEMKLNDCVEPLHFRSGIANLTEIIAYQAANQAIGTSLAFINKKALLTHTQHAIRLKKPVFIDNGLITSVTTGKPICVNSIITQYMDLVSAHRGCKNLSIVIPDNPYCDENALNIITTFKSAIRSMAGKCRVIIPIHRTSTQSIVEQALKISKTLGQIRLTLSVPCLNKGKNMWRLELSEIELLLMLKDPRGKVIFDSVHFLGLSEASGGRTYTKRLDLSRMYQLKNISFDSNRTPALFGSAKATSLRKGNKAQVIVNEQITNERVRESQNFWNYQYENEMDEPALWDEVNDLTVSEKVSLWNSFFPSMLIEADKDSTEKLDAFNYLTDQYFDYFIEKAKSHFIDMFTMPEHRPTAFESRLEAITLVMNQNPSNKLPVQLAIGF